MHACRTVIEAPLSIDYADWLFTTPLLAVDFSFLLRGGAGAADPCTGDDAAVRAGGWAIYPNGLLMARASPRHRQTYSSSA